MTSWPSACALARALTVLERAGATGELEASALEGRARLAIVGGRVVAVDSPTLPAPRLGSFVTISGIAADAVERAAAERAEGVRVGDALVRAGLAGRGAISHALRMQLRARIRGLARWGSLELRFEAGTARERIHAEPVPAGELILGAMRDALAREDTRSVRTRLGPAPLWLTPLGAALVDGSPLWPDEHAVCTLLRKGGTTVEKLEIACRGSDRAMRLVLALRVVEGAAPPAPSNTSLSLLARKVHDVRRARSAEELLDIKRGADPDEARRAWRRLAGTLHPDRFAAGQSAAIARASNEVASALNGAARQLRAAR